MPPNDGSSYNFGGYDLSQMMINDRPTVFNTLVAHVSGMGSPVYPHHPLNCNEPATWDWNGDDDMACKHASVPITDEKLQAAIHYSVACLLIELASKL